MNKTPDAIYEDVLEILEKAFNDLHDAPPNQQGMPNHLRDVAADFSEAKGLIGVLENYALNSARSWEKNLYGYKSNNNSGYNSNATMEVGGKRRNRRKTRKTRRGRKN
jgi:hypothetical protein